eukprot:763400-Hanusia_phi.AAC.2
MTKSGAAGNPGTRTEPGNAREEHSADGNQPLSAACEQKAVDPARAAALKPGWAGRAPFNGFGLPPDHGRTLEFARPPPQRPEGVTRGPGGRPGRVTRR